MDPLCLPLDQTKTRNTISMRLYMHSKRPIFNLFLRSFVLFPTSCYRARLIRALSCLSNGPSSRFKKGLVLTITSARNLRPFTCIIMFIHISFVTLIFALSAFGMPMKRDATQVMTDIEGMNNKTSSLDKAINDLPSGGATLAQVMVSVFKDFRVCLSPTTLLSILL